jgi:hypothetical protein
MEYTRQRLAAAGDRYWLSDHIVVVQKVADMSANTGSGRSGDHRTHGFQVQPERPAGRPTTQSIDSPMGEVALRQRGPIGAS